MSLVTCYAILILHKYYPVFDQWRTWSCSAPLWKLSIRCSVGHFRCRVRRHYSHRCQAPDGRRYSTFHNLSINSNIPAPPKQLSLKTVIEPWDLNFNPGNVGVGLGIQGSHGHADFFPNNGKEQPGCKDGVYNAILQEDGSFIYGNDKWQWKNLILHAKHNSTGIRRFLGCDHMRAYEYFTESIRSTPCKFAAFACSSWDSFLSGNCTSRKNYMGLNARKPEITNMQASPEESGSKYYLVTGSKSPFCKDHFLLTISLKEEASYRGTSDLHLILHSGTGRGAVSSTLVIGWT